MVSGDRKTWDTRSKGLPFSDIAVSPDDSNVLVAAGPDGLVGSDDSGRSWSKISSQRAAYLSWTKEGLFGVSPEGRVARSTDGGEKWQSPGSVERSPAALLVAEDEVYVAVHEAGIMQSTTAARLSSS